MKNHFQICFFRVMLLILAFFPTILFSQTDTTKTLNTNINLNSCFISEDMRNNICADSNVVFLSNNGQSWQRINNVISSSNYVNLRSIFFIDSLVGWVAGDNGKAAKTIDGGQNWDDMNMQIQSRINQIRFSNSDLGWAVGNNGIILKTTNGGSNWSVNYQYFIVNSLNSIYVFQSDSNLIYVGGTGGFISKSTNQGTNWQSSNININKNILSLKFVDSLVGYVVGEDKLICKTTNGGQSWDSIAPPQTSSGVNFTSLVAFSDSSIVVCADNGLIYQTDDNGNAWTTLNVGNNNSINCIHYQCGYILGAGDSGSYIQMTAVDPNLRICYDAYNLCLNMCGQGNNSCIKQCGEIFIQCLKILFPRLDMY
ncbi:MAG: hypothetical protein A2X64_10530 [Ignavibacteria bacterium GWF2_33_9]|nr:MAG: hypothetical protein A2X64_10530 [Ignavibacteria bacterium GWF2_33_9]